MTLQEAMAQLECKGDPKVRAQNVKNGAPENQFGVKLGDVRTVAKAIKSDHELGLQLWATGNLEAMFLATLILKPKLLAPDELEQMTSQVTYSWLADWLMSYVTKQHPDKEALRIKWMESDHPMLARAGWSLTTERVAKSPDGLDLGGLLDRLDREMGSAESPNSPELKGTSSQRADVFLPPDWMMNFCLIEIGVGFPEHRQRAIEIGERHGLYRDYPVSKGCTSPFAPICINELASRKG